MNVWMQWGVGMDNLIVECRLGEYLEALIMPEGRASVGGRREVFAPNSCEWPSTGISLLTEHRGQEIAKVWPSRVGTEIRIKTKATPEIRAAYQSKPCMSIEFIALDDVITAGGIREIRKALVKGVAMVARGEYPTKAEIRSEKRRWHYLL